MSATLLAWIAWGQEPIPVGPQGVVTILVHAQNTTQRPMVVEAEIHAPEGWTILVPFVTQQLEPSARIVQPVVLRTSPRAPEGIHQVTVSTLTDREVASMRSIPVVVPARPSIHVAMEAVPSLLTTPRAQILVRVSNTGNVVDEVTVTTMDGRLETQVPLLLAPGDVATVPLNLRLDAAPGVLQRVPVRVQAHSEAGASARAEAFVDVLIPGSPPAPRIPTVVRVQADSLEETSMTGSVQGEGSISEEGDQVVAFLVSRNAVDPPTMRVRYREPGLRIQAGDDRFRIHDEFDDHDGRGISITLDGQPGGWPFMRAAAHLVQDGGQPASVAVAPRPVHVAASFRAEWQNGMRAEVVGREGNGEREGLTGISVPFVPRDSAWHGRLEAQVHTMQRDAGKSVATWRGSADLMTESTSVVASAWWRPEDRTGSLQGRLTARMPAFTPTWLGHRITSDVTLATRHGWGGDRPEGDAVRVTAGPVDWHEGSATVRADVASTRLAVRLVDRVTQFADGGMPTRRTDVDAHLHFRPRLQLAHYGLQPSIITSLGWTTESSKRTAHRYGVQASLRGSEVDVTAGLEMAVRQRGSGRDELRAYLAVRQVFSWGHVVMDWNVDRKADRWTYEAMATWQDGGRDVAHVGAQVRVVTNGAASSRHHVVLHGEAPWPLPAPWHGVVTVDFAHDLLPESTLFTGRSGDSLGVVAVRSTRGVAWREEPVDVALEARLARHVGGQVTGFAAEGEVTWRDGHALTGTVAMVASQDAMRPTWQFRLRAVYAFGLPVPQRERSGRVEGVVLDDRGQPVSGMVVDVGGVATRTDAAGVFVLARVPVGAHVVRFPLAGRTASLLLEPADGTVLQVVADATTRLDVRAAPPGRVSADLRIDHDDAAGLFVGDGALRVGSSISVEGWRVTLQRGSSRRTAVSDAEGRVTLSNLMPGRWNVSLAAPIGFDADRVEIRTAPSVLDVLAGAEIFTEFVLLPRVQEVALQDGGALEVP